MTYKEIREAEDCTLCPLYQDECPGGWTSSPSGTPIEPPCCMWDDDTDVDEYAHKSKVYVAAREAEEDNRIRMLKERNERNRIAQQRRRESKMHVYKEICEIKSLQRKIASNEAVVRLAESLGFAFNVTNEMFGYDERYSSDRAMRPELKQNEEYRNRIAEVEEIKKRKLSELRKQRKTLGA